MALAPAGISVDTLSNDIQNLIGAMKAEFTQNPHDAGVQSRLRALLDLQGVIQRTSLPRDQLELIKNKVTELAAVRLRPAPAPGSGQNSTLVPPQAHAPAPHSASVTPAPGPPSGSAPVTLDGLLGPGALAAILARQSATPQNAAPNPPPYVSSAMLSPPTVQTEQPKPPAPTPNALSLVDQLRHAGMLPQAAPPGAAASPAAAPAAPQASILPPNIANLLSSAKAKGLTGLAPPADPALSAAALKSQ